MAFLTPCMIISAICCDTWRFGVLGVGCAAGELFSFFLARAAPADLVSYTDAAAISAAAISAAAFSAAASSSVPAAVPGFLVGSVSIRA